MQTLVDSIQISVPVAQVFEWFEHFTENYTRWHPDHVKSMYIKGESMKINARIYSEEYLHGELHKIVFILTKISINQEIQYKFPFPTSLIMPRGSFKFESVDTDICRFTAALSFRFTRLFERIFPDRVRAIKQHMKEEGLNLKQLLEKTSS